MDRMIYLSMSGAKQTLGRQAEVAHNLANVNTNGFRAETMAFRAVPVVGEGAATRAFVMDTTVGADFTPGAIQHTGRDLDIAVQGKGWIAVQASDGSEAYTRAGSLKLDANGMLQTRSGNAVLGDGGPISVSAGTIITIASDGTVSTVQAGTGPGTAASTVVGRIKLVNPPEAGITRGDDGLFRARGNAAPDADVRIASGALEGSNVNVVEAMVSMIALARQFDAHMKTLQNAEGNARQAAQLLTLQG